MSAQKENWKMRWARLPKRTASYSSKSTPDVWTVPKPCAALAGRWQKQISLTEGTRRSTQGVTRKTDHPHSQCIGNTYTKSKPNFSFPEMLIVTRVIKYVVFKINRCGS